MMIERFGLAGYMITLHSPGLVRVGGGLGQWGIKMWYRYLRCYYTNMVTCTELWHRRRNYSSQQNGVSDFLVRFTLGFTIVLGVILPQLALANCGNIIGPADFFSDWIGIETMPIYNCSNPFGSIAQGQPHTFSVEGKPATHGSEIIIPKEGTTNYALPNIELRPWGGTQMALYRHDGDDYRYFSTREVEPGESDFRLLASLFFAPEVDAEPYVQQIMGNNVSDDVEFDWDLYDEFYNHIYSNYKYGLPVLLPGTYIFLSQEFSEPPMAKIEWWENLKNFLLPTAHAQSSSYPIYATTFTLTAEVEEPEGASNILFIPGIMGSRLYEERDLCGETEFGTELWFSTDECKQMRLTTRFYGDSVNPIYTKGSEEGIVDDAFIFSNIYESFLENLADWKEEDLINDYSVLPYDWRMELDDILKSKYDPSTGRIFTDQVTSVSEGLLYKLINQLAKGSKNGKVTIVAHSNGGLVIKQLLSSLQHSNDPLLEKIDNLILVAVPQEGSMGSAVGVLHGEKLNFIMSQEVTRRLMNTMPFSHHLLPTQGYFDSVETPAIVFEPGSVTDAWIAQFGSTITNQDDLHRFISTESGREKPTLDDLAIPETADPFLLQYARTTDAIQNNFEVSQGMKVYQVAGTGLLTPAQLSYFTDRECVSRVLFVCTGYAPKLGYRISMTIDGDDTVPVPSALSLVESGDIERWWLNLFDYNDNEINREHKDIFEITELSKYIEDVLFGIEGTYDYLHDSEPELDEGERLVFQLHSPLDLFVVLGDGSVVGSSTPILRGVQYHRYGELQYLSIPEEEVGHEVRLSGLASGSFTLDVESHSGDTLLERTTYSAIPSSTSTQVVYRVAGDTSSEETALEIDYDGDGVFEATAMPGLGMVTKIEGDTAPDVEEVSGGGSTGTKVKSKVLPQAPTGGLASVTIYSSEQELMLQLIKILEQYRDLLVYINL